MKLWSSYLKELKLSSKGFYFYVEIAMTVILLIVLLFVIPENYTGTQEEYLTLDLPKSAEEMFVSELEKEDKDGKAEVIELKLKKRVILADLYEWEGQEVYIIEDEKDMIDLAEKDRPLIGASLSWNEESSSLKYDYYIQGYESDRLKNFYKIINNKNIDQIVENSNAVEVKSLETGYEQLNTRQTALPALLTFNGSLMGMFIMAAYIFLDKGEGVIKAYAVTASKIWHYLLSKALTLITVTIITTMAIVIPVMGTQPAYWAMLILLVTSAFFSSSLGLLISSFFDNMTKAFGVIYIVMMIFMLPAIAYFIPSWNPTWIQAIPVYYLIMGFKETILVNGDMIYVMFVSLGFLLGGVGLFLLANKKFKNSLAF